MGWISHRKWKETKQLPGTARPGNMLGCCLISFHFMWVIHSSSSNLLNILTPLPPLLCGRHIWNPPTERSRATITLQRLLHLILLLAAQRTGVINSPPPPPFRNIRVPKLAEKERSHSADSGGRFEFDKLIVTRSSLSEVVNLFCLISRQIKSLKPKLKGGAAVAAVGLVF